MEKTDKGTVVNFQYGAIGSALKPGTKTPAPVSEEEADKIYTKLVKEKMGKGYAEREGSEKKNNFSGQPVIASKVTHSIFPQLLNAIDNPQDFIDDDRYIAQEKKDGERRIIKSDRDANVLLGLNKKGSEVPLSDGIRDAITYFKCIVDGEIIGDKLFVFDILSLRDVDLVNMTCEKRIKLLESLHFGKAIEIVKTAYTREEKQKMYDELKSRNAEGIVFKLKDSVYRAGRPNSFGAQLKFKFQKTGTFIVKDHTKGKRSVGLELMDENSNRVSVGKVTIPPNKSIPEIGAFVEVQYLYAFDGGCIFQPVFLNERFDCDMTDIKISQLVYKEEQEA